MQRVQHPGGQQTDCNCQRGPGRHGTDDVGRQDFAAHEHQHRRQRVTQVVKAFGQVGQAEVKRSQAEDGEDIGCVDNERILGDCEDRGNGVHREQKIEQLDQHHSEQQWRCPPALRCFGGALTRRRGPDEEALAVEPIGDGQAAL